MIYLFLTCSPVMYVLIYLYVIQVCGHLYTCNAHTYTQAHTYTYKISNVKNNGKKNTYLAW